MIALKISQKIPFVFECCFCQMSGNRVVDDIDKTGKNTFTGTFRCIAGTHHQFSFHVVLIVVSGGEHALQIPAECFEHFDVGCPGKYVDMVEHDAQSFDADAVPSCKDRQKCQEKDIVICPVKQNITFQRFEIKMVCASFLEDSILLHSLSYYSGNATKNYPFTQIGNGCAMQWVNYQIFRDIPCLVF